MTTVLLDASDVHSAVRRYVAERFPSDRIWVEFSTDDEGRPIASARVGEDLTSIVQKECHS